MSILIKFAKLFTKPFWKEKGLFELALAMLDLYRNDHSDFGNTILP
jgi:hypothetical protein